VTFVAEKAFLTKARPVARDRWGIYPASRSCSKAILAREGLEHNLLIMQILTAAVFGQEGE
jgi:hypothetical protein